MPDTLRFLLQIIIIVAAARLTAVLLTRLGQPAVIGEILAGILLGPTLFGWLAPGAMQFLFPVDSIRPLNAVSQVGLILFMFLVGLRLDLDHPREHRRSTLFLSITNIAIPFARGALLGFSLYSRLAPPGVPVTAFSLFFGVAISITAFPVLARIVTDLGLLSHPLGVIALTCAAVDDAAAWVLLGAVIASAWTTLLLFVLYIAVIVAARPALRLFDPGPDRSISHGRLAIVLVFALISAAATEWIGIHPFFGAFFAGVAMPKRNEFVAAVTAMLEPITLIVLLPVFFACTGLRMTARQAGLRVWADLALIIAVAIAGKCGGAMIAGRASGLTWRDATALGVLLNTRGLVELVVLNVGLDLHIVTPALFSMMVLMAMVTTAMATPLLRVLIRPASPAAVQS